VAGAGPPQRRAHPGPGRRRPRRRTRRRPPCRPRSLLLATQWSPAPPQREKSPPHRRVVDEGVRWHPRILLEAAALLEGERPAETAALRRALVGSSKRSRTVTSGPRCPAAARTSPRRCSFSQAEAADGAIILLRITAHPGAPHAHQRRREGGAHLHHVQEDRPGHPERHTHKVPLPAGLRDGQKVRIGELGGPGKRRRARDLYVTVHIDVEPRGGHRHRPRNRSRRRRPDALNVIRESPIETAPTPPAERTASVSTRR
jgi:hypothetical protein